MEHRKKAVSIRLGANDVRNVKRLAKRLSVRDSDVIRTAVKLLLTRLAPLYDGEARGKNLVPVFVEFGSELFRHFDIDTARLDSILNDGVSEEARVDVEDVQLLALSGQQRSYLKLRLSHLGTNQLKEGTRLVRHPGEEDSIDKTLRQYLYEKYVYNADQPAQPTTPPTPPTPAILEVIGR